MPGEPIVKVRASSADQVWDCVESIMAPPGEVTVNPEHDATRVGNAFHAWAQHIDDDERPSSGEYAEQFGCDPEELDRLCAYACVAWRELQDWFGGGDVEQSMSQTCTMADGRTWLLTGTVDRLALDVNVAYILDWKTGYIEAGYEHQQRAYGALVCLNNELVEKVFSCRVYPRLGLVDTKEYSAVQLLEWLGHFETRISNGLGSFAPGPHCERCKRRATCPGIREATQSALACIDGDAAIVNLTASNKAELGPVLAEQVRKVRFVAKRCDEYLGAVRDMIRPLGSVPAGDDGRVLKLIPQNRRKIKPAEAWPVLHQFLDDSQVLETVKVSLTAVEKAVADNADRGQKGIQKKRLAAALEDAKAIEINVTETMRETKE